MRGCHPLLQITRTGILQIEALADVDSDSKDSCWEGSEVDKNLEICQLEKCDFDIEKETE
jgi:hypothetical protein